MPLIDSTIYQNAPQSALRYALNGYDNAMRANDAASQRKDAESQRKLEEAKRRRDQEFQQNLSGLMGSYGEYGHTPEGQREIFDHMAKAGYAKEMIGLMGGIPAKETPPNNAQIWHGSTNGNIFNGATGEFKSPPVIQSAAQTNDSVSPKINPIAEARLAETKRMNDARIAAMDKKDTSPKIGSALANRSLLSDWGKSRFDYEKTAKPYLALKAIKDSPSYGTGVGDQSMIDKIIMIETGRVPTEAQYFQFAHNLGIEDKIDRVTGRLKSGAILGEDARRNIEAQADEQMKIAHNAYDTDYSQAEGMANKNNVDPGKVLRKGGYYDEVGKMLTRSDSNGQNAQTLPAPNSQQSQVAQPKSKAERDALPPGTKYIGPDGKMATKQ